VAERVRRQRLDPDARREAIVSVAQELLAHESPDQLSMELIARRIGASPSLVHHYFGTKDGLVEAALIACAEELIHLLVGDRERPPAEQLTGGLTRYLDYIGAHPVSWSSLLRATGPTAAAIAERVDQRAVEFCLEALHAQAHPPATLRVALRGWIALIKDVCWRWLNDGDLNREQAEMLLQIAFIGCLQAAAAADSAAQPALDAFNGR
jgi:AcrR family transcriptional regulator